MSTQPIVIEWQDAPADEHTAARAVRNQAAAAKVKPAPGQPRDTTTQELAAAGRELYGALARPLAELATAYGESDRSVTELAAMLRRVPHDEILATTPPEQVTWLTLANLIEHDPERARDVYAAIKQAARDELRTGLRASRAVEGTPGTPYERAQFAVILEQFRVSYLPQNPAEDLLVQQMAIAVEKSLRWQEIATKRTEEGEWSVQRDRRRLWDSMTPRERDRHEREYGYLPPRVTDAEAIEQATLNAERYMRSFRGLLRTFQMMRNRLNTVIMTGGQLNVAERQMVMPPANAAD